MQDSDLGELNQWAPKMLAKMQTLPELRDVASDQQTHGTTLTLTIDRDQASRYGLTAQIIDDTLYDAFGQRQIAQYFTQLSSYEVIMEVLPSLQGDVDDARQDLSEVADDRRRGAAFRLREMDDDADPAAVDQPSGPVPGDHDQLQPRAGRRARPGDGRDRARPERTEASSHHQHQLPGQRPGLPGFAVDRAAADPRARWSSST